MKDQHNKNEIEDTELETEEPAAEQDNRPRIEFQRNDDGTLTLTTPGGQSVSFEAHETTEGAMLIGDGEATPAGDDVLELIAPPSDQPEVVESKIVNVAGQPREFLIKRLSRRESDRINSKKFRKTMSGAFEMSDEGDLDVLAHLLHACLVKNVGTAKAPVYEPLWTMEQIVGKRPERDPKSGKVLKPGAGGLLDYPSMAAEQLITALEVAVYTVNPSCDPVETARAMQMLGLL